MDVGFELSTFGMRIPCINYYTCHWVVGGEIGLYVFNC